MTQTVRQSSQLLGVEPTATVDEIKKAYRKIAKRLHPDRNGGDQQSFRKITAAYQALLNEKRAGSSVKAQVRPKSTPARVQTPTYSGFTRSEVEESDPQERKVDFGSFKFSWSEQFAKVESERRQRSTAARGDVRSKRMNPSVAPTERTTETASISTDDPADWKQWRKHITDIDQNNGQTSSDPEARTEEENESTGIWGWLKKQKRQLQTHRVSLPGEDVKLRLKTTEQTLLFGGDHRLALQRQVACPSCQGLDFKSCDICRQTGRVKVREEVVVHVPPSALSGTLIRVPGKGTAGLSGHQDGDLLLVVEPQLPQGFRLAGYDLEGTLRVAPSLAISGGVVEVTVPRGRVKLRVPPRSQSGTKLRLRSLGLQQPDGLGCGDIMLELTIGRPQ